MKVRWLVRFNDRDKGFVSDVPDAKGKNWIDRRMVEHYEEPVKSPVAPPHDKMKRRPRGKK